MDDVLTPREAGRVLKVAARTLANWRHKGQGPRFVKLDGGLVRYHRADLEAYLHAHRHTSTASALAGITERGRA